jgi:enoyl-CoA hydratase/carnithine racemase
MGDELVDAMRRGIRDEAAKAVVVTGAGRAFCAGADRAFYNGERGRSGLQLGQEYFLCGFVNEIVAANKPFIAAVNGIACGIGATMLLPFDIRLASENSVFDFPFVKLGVAPGFGSSYFLPRLIGIGSASDVLLNSRRLGADTALQLGLVQQIIPSGQLLDSALAMARYITSAPDGIVSSCKKLLAGGAQGDLAKCLQREQLANEARIGNFSGGTH